MKTLLLAATVLVSMGMSATAADAKSISGSSNGLSWTATSTVIGQTSTATIAGGGNPIYLGTAAKYRGVVGLLMDYGADGQFVCSGSLSANRSSIITAGHCVTIFGRAPDSVTAYFYNPVTADPAETPVYTPGAPNVTTVDISRIYVNPLYTGSVIDDHDIAALRLGSAAPSFAVGYELDTGTDLTGVDYNIAGFGRRSNVGGAAGVGYGQGLGTGRLRQGDNRYDFRLGDPDFGGFFTSGFFGGSPDADIAYSYLADFDSGSPFTDASCGLANALGVALSSKYCDLGRGLTEVSTAGGDSGGPQFVNGRLASVTSYGLTFGSDVFPGDIDNALNDTFGEFNGFVPIFYNLDFLSGAIPEPATWAMMLAGFGLVGAAARRRKVGYTVA